MAQLMTVEHSPTLTTIRMVEKALRDAKQTVTIAELKRKLPRQVNHNTLKAILAYLHESGKITYGPEGILWTYIPREELFGILTKAKRW